MDEKEQSAMYDSMIELAQFYRNLSTLTNDLYISHLQLKDQVSRLGDEINELNLLNGKRKRGRPSKK